MPRYLLLLSHQVTPPMEGAARAAWARWIAPQVREGVVQAAGAFAGTMHALTRDGAVRTVSHCAPRAGASPWGFVLVEAENEAAVVALAGSAPESLVERAEVRAIEPQTEAGA